MADDLQEGKDPTIKAEEFQDRGPEATVDRVKIAEDLSSGKDEEEVAKEVKSRNEEVSQEGMEKVEGENDTANKDSSV